MNEPLEYQRAVSQQGHYAGAFTRLAAFSIDQLVAATLFSIGSAGTGYIVRLLTGHVIDLSGRPLLVGLIYAAWSFLYLAGCWAANGQTVGMGLAGLRVVQADGSPARPRAAAVRALTLPLGFMTFGIAFLGILWRSDRRAVHDRLAGTAVVYSWDARGAQLRFLATRTSSPPGR